MAQSQTLLFGRVLDCGTIHHVQLNAREVHVSFHVCFFLFSVFLLCVFTSSRVNRAFGVSVADKKYCGAII